MAIALEPEAAAVYCKSVRIMSPAVDKTEDTTGAFESKTRYLLADMGGGTVDVTVHEVGKDKKIRELHHATGGAWGGTYVDQNFVLLLKNIFGKASIEKFQADHPCDWVDLVSVKFESAKRAAAVGKPIRVELTHEFLSFLEREGCSAAKCVKDVWNDDVKFSRGALTLEYPEVAKLFDPVFENITAHLKSILEKVDDIKFVILVGGFATSLLLQEHIKREVASRYSLRVITAYNCSLAVVLGSVLFGHDSTLIASRRVKYSYGISSYLPFEKGIDPDSYRFVDDDGSVLCRHRFFVFAKRNDEVAVGQEIERSVYPLYADTKKLTISVYTSLNAGSRYTKDNDDNMKNVANIRLPMPNTEKGKNRRVQVAMHFGETEIKVTSEDTSSGEARQHVVDLDFLEHS